jgi:hypothetical protein
MSFRFRRPAMTTRSGRSGPEADLRTCAAELVWGGGVPGLRADDRGGLGSLLDGLDLDEDFTGRDGARGGAENASQENGGTSRR